MSSPTASTTIVPELLKEAVRAHQANPKASFPCMVHQCLVDIDELCKRDPSMEKLKKIVSWQNHGRAFRIHDRKGFESVIMPVWFVRLKYNSFLRQLSTFGFKKIYRESKVVQKGAWYHDLFVQGKPELAEGIQKLGKAPKTQPSISAPLLQVQSYGQHGLTVSDSTNNDTMEDAMTQNTMSFLRLQQSIARTTKPLPVPVPLQQHVQECEPLEETQLAPPDGENPLVGLVLRNLDLAFPEQEPLDCLEPNPIPPGGFTGIPPKRASQILQQQLYQVLYDNEDDHLLLEPRPLPEMLNSNSNFCHTWAA